MNIYNKTAETNKKSEKHKAAIYKKCPVARTNKPTCKISKQPVANKRNHGMARWKAVAFCIKQCGHLRSFPCHKHLDAFIRCMSPQYNKPKYYIRPKYSIKGQNDNGHPNTKRHQKMFRNKYCQPAKYIIHGSPCNIFCNPSCHCV